MASTSKSHLLIAGIGRSGTTLLVQLLDGLGLDTDLAHGNLAYDNAANAGFETVPIKPDSVPYVLKSPWSYQFLNELMEKGEIKIDCVLIPIRNLSEAVSSRIILDLRSIYASKHHPARHFDGVWRNNSSVAGGITYSLEPIDNQRILASAFYDTVEICVRHNIAMQFIHFPRFAFDVDYAFQNLKGYVKDGVSFEQFKIIYDRIVAHDKVRTEKEFESLDIGSIDQSKDIPSLEKLESVALKRILIEYQNSIDSAWHEVQALKAEILKYQQELKEKTVDLDLTRQKMEMLENILQTKVGDSSRGSGERG